MIGNGEGNYSFIHVADATSATVATLEGARPGVYNIVDDDPVPAAEWMPVYAEALGTKRPLRVPEFLARMIVGDALITWMLGLRGASNERSRRSSARVRSTKGGDEASSRMPRSGPAV